MGTLGRSKASGRVVLWCCMVTHGCATLHKLKVFATPPKPKF